ncbi:MULTISPECIES: RNA polymerase sigma factor [Crateriforma]|uniref:ECF RNA polymerase sigma factor SigE n=1 Tax=Crateriforma conspicua TaxID=2527996 RepID=A0A5C6FPQ4_9PLAN|nr:MULTISPECIES: sigma-70 family RNA polymerase sigma factor [Crateriforma]TWU62403.1 ECF RNA polymerase sigma factor SigE [Crateriforma conspicua]
MPGSDDPPAASTDPDGRPVTPQVPSDESADDANLTPAQLIQRHQRGVWRYLRMLGCDEATADDLTQDTFLRVLRRKNFVQHNDSATAGYLRRTAYNLLISQHRKTGRMRTVGDSVVLDEAWQRWAGKDLTGDAATDALRQCLKQLTDRAQMALRMRFAEQASRIEIGDALGITDHGARNLMQRAKKQLRDCVDQRLNQTESDT